MKKTWKQSEEKKDVLYWLDGTTYRLLDEVSWSGIEAGRAKL